MRLILLDFWEDIQTFLEMGGDVLFVILFVTFLMWVLLVERMWYMAFIHPKHAQKIIDGWKARKDQASWHARKIRRKQLSELSQSMNRSLSMIKTLIALCPLLGLLGTVTGMIEVFDVMALVGSGNARAMASGVSMATMPTMAGMVAALSGLYFSARLDSKATVTMGKVEDTLQVERG